jgi:GMP synthase (glutamine-hydrolysing)
VASKERTVLVVQPEKGAPAGWFGERLEALGCRLDVRHPYDGQELPAVAAYDGLLVLGGAMDSWDDEAFPWLAGIRARVREAGEAGVPTLGICLGHQLAGLALGGRVARNPDGASVGLRPMGWLPEASEDPLTGSATGATTVAHWNSDVITALPDGATVLARTPDGAVQAARLAPTVWGVQCHPEVDGAIVRGWIDEELPRVEDEPGRGALNDFGAAVQDREGELRDQWEPLAASFARLVQERP